MAKSNGSNGHSDEPLRAPKGGIRVEKKFYRGGARMPEKYRRQSGEHVDPATAVPMAAPNFSRFALPHAITFVGKQSTMANVYRNPDEAIQRASGQAWKMRRDPVVMGPLEARQRAVSLLNWHLEVEDEKDPKQKELQVELTKIIKRSWNFTEYRRVMLEALWYGRYAVQHKFGFAYVGGKRRCIVQDWRPINGDKLVFRFDDGSGQYSDDEVGVKVTPIYGQHDKLAGDRVLEITDQGMAYFLEPWERSMMGIHRHIIEDGDYEDPISAGRVHGVGIRDRIWWCWYQKQETMAQMMEVINRTGSGITIYWYPAGDEAAKEAQLEIAEKQRYDNVLVMPRLSGDPSNDAYGIERIEPTATGVQLLQGVVHEFFGHQIVRYIAGQTLSSESSAMGIGSGAADFQSETWGQICKYDAVKLEETITHELIDRSLKPFNFPEAKDIPVWFRIDTQSAESHKKLEAIKSGWDMGLRIKASDVMDVIGLSMPGEDDETLQNPALIQQARLASQQFGGQEQGQDQLRDLFGPLADLVSPMDEGGEGGQPDAEQQVAMGAAEQPQGGEPPATPPGPAQYAKPKKKLAAAAAGQMGLWKEELHPREQDGEFAEKHGVAPMHVDDWMDKLEETNKYEDSPKAQAIQEHLFKTLAAADIHPEQVNAMISGDPEHVNALKQHAMETGQHEPAFSLTPQKAKLGLGLGAGDKNQLSGGKQQSMWHGMDDKEGQGKLFGGMDLGGAAVAEAEPEAEPEAAPEEESPEDVPPPPEEEPADPHPSEHEHEDGDTLSADDVLDIIKDSPRQGGTIDWDRYAERFGIEGNFSKGTAAIDDLKELVNNGHLRLSKHVDQGVIDEKAKSGKLNPVIISKEPGKRMVVLDGTHSLHAAIKRGDANIPVIVNDEVAGDVLPQHWSASNEAKLSKRAQAGDKDARDDLIKQFEPLAKKLARKAATGGRDEVDEFVQLGRIAINKAIDGFDPSKARFSTYATMAIVREIARSRQKAAQSGAQIGEDEEGKTIEPEDSREKSPEENAVHKEQQAWLANAIEGLPRDIGKVMQRSLQGGSNTEIAKELNLSDGAISQMLTKGKRLLLQMKDQPEFKALNYRKSPVDLFRYFKKNKLWRS